MDLSGTWYLVFRIMEVVNARLHPDRSRTMSGIEPLLKANEVTSIFQISVASLYRRMAMTRFPNP